MHDLFEGVVPYELKLLLCHCVHAKYFTVRKLNERIKEYDFGCNIPVPIDPKVLGSNSKIRQSASQMMTLSRELPLLIADTIPHDDQNWHSFLVLLKICSIAVSPLCTHDTIAYLRVLIEEKLYLFQQLYPEESMIPKLHSKIHYPSQIERLGPLIQSWNMRQESKLGFVKRVSRRGNYKNVYKRLQRNINSGFVIRFSHSQLRGTCVKHQSDAMGGARQWRVGPGNGAPAKHFNGAQIASNTQQHTTLTPHTAVLEYNVSKVSIKWDGPRMTVGKII